MTGVSIQADAFFNSVSAMRTATGERFVVTASIPHVGLSAALAEFCAQLGALPENLSAQRNRIADEFMFIGARAVAADRPSRRGGPQKAV